MRWARAAFLAGVALTAIVVGVWWRGSVAEAQRRAPGAAEAGVTPELFAKSRGFRDLLEAVQRRGEELDRREQAVAAREAAVTAAEQTLAGEAARQEAPGWTPAAGEGCSVAVTRVYQSMRPEEAAPILDRLDDATVRTILGCMKERQVGAILAAMRHERAVAVTKLLANRR